MCRKTKKDNPFGDWCTALGQDKRFWDKDCLLRPIGNDDPSAQVEKFIVKLKDMCADSTLDSNKLEDVELTAQHEQFKKWYIMHGKMSGNFRAHGISAKIRKPISLIDSGKINDKLFNTILERDCYRCQYCGCLLIIRDIWKNLARLSLSFGNGHIVILNQAKRVKDEDVSGLVFATWPYVDHVLAHKRGGATVRENLVAACFACNFGKNNFTCEELGIKNPLEESSKKGELVLNDNSKWDGLKSYLSKLEIF